MALATTTWIAIAGLAVAATGTYVGIEARKDAAKANALAAAEQRKAKSEEKALNFQAQAAEKRQQIREERVRRARLLQASENSGLAGSSGEVGAVGGMNTMLQANLGMNRATAEAGSRIGGYLQNAADFHLAAQKAASKAQDGDAYAGLGMSIFSSAGGAGQIGSDLDRIFSKKKT